MSKAIGAAFLVATLGLLTLLGFKGLLSDGALSRDYVATLADYSSAGSGHYRQLTSKHPGHRERMDVHFTFKVDTVREHDNVFQTAPLNEGLRMELDPVNERDFVAGLVLGKYPNSQARGFRLPGEYRLGVQHEASIRFVDGELVARVDQQQALRVEVGQVPILLSDVRTGIGFDDLRRLTGEVRHFRLRSSALPLGVAPTFQKIEQIILWLGIACVLLLGLFLYSAKRKEHSAPTPEKAAVPVQERGFARRNDLLLVVRAFACFVVVLTHVYGSVGPENWRRVLVIGKTNLSWLVHSTAWVGMWIFFTLSGYLMGKAFFTRRYSPTYKGILSFYYNRGLRIAPLYVLVIFIVVFFSHVDLIKWEYVDVLVKHLLFVYDGQQRINPIGALWSISTEMHYYLVVPFLALVFLDVFVAKRRRYFWVFLLVVVLGLLYRRTFCLSHNRDYMAWLNYVYVPFVSNADLFMGGFFLSAALSGGLRGNHGWVGRTYSSIPWVLTAILVALYVLGARTMYTGFMEGNKEAATFVQEVLPTVTMLATAFLIWVIEARKSYERSAGVQKSGRIRNWVLSVLEHFGILTYGIYVWHTPVMDQVMRIFPLQDVWTTYLWRLAATFGISIALSQFTYVVLERNMEKKKLFA